MSTGSNHQMRTEPAMELQPVINCLPFYVLVVDSSHNILMANEAVRASLGVEPEKIVGAFCPRAVHGLDEPFPGCPLEESLEKGCCTVEKEVYDSYGDRWYNSAVYPLDKKGVDGRPLYLHFVRDITDVKRVEHEKDRLQEQFRQAQKMEAIGQLTAGFAHDFNNVLAGILACAELVRDDAEKGSRIAEGADKIIESSNSAAGRIRQLLTFSRQARVRSGPIDYHACIERALNMVRHTPDKRIAFVLGLEAEVSTATGDASHLDSVFLNLCINACEAMPHGGTLTISTRNVAVGDEPRRESGATLSRGEWIEVRVKDTGVGMDPATVARIFEPFFTTKPSSTSTGLGLASAFGIVKQHNGEITVDSEPGQGTTFTLYLPVQRFGLSTDSSPQRPETSKPPARLLFVEDDTTVREGITELLERRGYRVTGCGDGRKAVEAFTSAHGSIDAVILDLMMPAMDGFECLRHLKQIDPGCPVIVASGYAREDTGKLLAEMGVSAFVEKPFGVAQLQEALDNVLGRNG